MWHPGDRVEVLAPVAGASRVTAPTGHGVAVWEGEPGLWDVLLAPVERPIGTKVARALKGGDRFAVPAEEVERLTSDYLPRLQRHLPVASSDDSVHVPELPRPRLALAVTWRAVDEVALTWSWRYRVGSDDRVYGLADTRGLRGIRAPEQEAELLAGLELDDAQTYRLCGGRREHGLLPEQVITGPAVIGFLDETLVPLEASGQVEIDESGHRPSFTELHEQPEVSFTSAPDQPGPESPTDWLDLQVVIRIGTRPLGLAQVLEAMTNGAERIILRDGAHIRIDRPEFDELRALVMAARELVEQPTDGVRVSRSDLGLWAELADLGIVDAQASAWTRAALALRDLTGLPEVEPAVDAELRPYQLDGFRWLAFLWRSGLGGILADDMGLGKTLQTLALVAHARGEGAAPFLVVAPTSVVATWAHEAATFVPGLTTRAITESRARRGVGLDEAVAGADLVVTSYTLYRMEAGGVRRAGVGRAGARRGPDGEEPRGQDLPGRTPSRRAVPGGPDRHADGEPAHGAVVAAVHRGARSLRLSRPVPARRWPTRWRRRPTPRCWPASAGGSARSCCAAPRTWWPATCRPSRSRCSR